MAALHSQDFSPVLPTRSERPTSRALAVCIPAGGLGFGVGRSVLALGVVRRRSVSELVAHPLDAAGKLLVGTLARRAVGRLTTSPTHELRGFPTIQRSLIFAAETLAEGLTYHLWERHVNRRVPRSARGYLQPHFDDIVDALLLAGVSAAGASWACREVQSSTVIVPPQRALYTYGTVAKTRELQRNGIPARTYLTSAHEASASRISELLALPGNPEVVATVDFVLPVTLLWRPIAADFGRSGGGDEYITQAPLPTWSFRIRSVQPLARPDTAEAHSWTRTRLQSGVSPSQPALPEQSAAPMDDRGQW